MINGETAYRLKGGFIEVLNKKLSSVWSHQGGAAAAAAANFPPGGTTRVKRKKIMLLLEKSHIHSQLQTQAGKSC